MTQLDIMGTAVEVEPALGVHLRAYQRLVGLALQACQGEIQPCDGHYAWDGLTGVGDALNPAHLCDGVCAVDVATGEQYDFRVFGKGGRPVRTAELRADGVVRDSLGLALTPGVNGYHGRLTIKHPNGGVSTAVSSGSVHDWVKGAQGQ